jgi:alpha-tubulin suppressor-like RCC1 family protein
MKPSKTLSLSLTLVAWMASGCSSYEALWADIPPYSPGDSGATESDAGDSGLVEGDADASTPEGLNRPVNVMATGLADGIEVTWGGVEGATGYELRIDGGTWSPVGDVTSYVDLEAPAPTLTGELMVSASEGDFRPHVALMATSTVESLDGEERTYEVRAVDQTTASAPSDAAVGARSAPPLSYQWYRLDGGVFAPLVGATALTHEDADTSPLGERHAYHLVASAGEQTLMSEDVEGWRLAVADLVTKNASTCALLTNGAVKCWGFNEDGNLGYGDTLSRGQRQGSMPTPDVDIGARVVAIHPATTGLCATDVDGALRCWGVGSSGKLGQGNTDDLGDTLDDFPIPTVDTGVTHVAVDGGSRMQCALSDGGELVCWGSNAAGALGQPKDVTPSLGTQPGDMPPPAVPLGSNVSTFTVGLSHICAAVATGKIKCWGLSFAGAANEALGYFPVPTEALGDDAGEMPPEDILITRNPQILSAGAYHTCAVDQLGDVRCWGLNNAGQLGVGDMTTRPQSAVEALNYPTVDIASVSLAEHYVRNPDAPRGTSEAVVALETNDLSTCALLEGGALVCWGAEYITGTVTSSPVYVPILGTIHKLAQSNAAAKHFCAIDTSGEALCWGSEDDSGKLGYEGEAVDLRTERARIKLW